MRCTFKNICVFGSLFGLLLFALGMGAASSGNFYYVSGVWLADVYVQGKGEAGIPAALLVGLVSSVVIGIIYVFLFCCLYNRHKRIKSGGSV